MRSRYVRLLAEAQSVRLGADHPAEYRGHSRLQGIDRLENQPFNLRIRPRDARSAARMAPRDHKLK